MTSKKSKRSIWMRFLAAALSLAITLGFTGCDKGTGEESSSESSDVSGGEDEQIEVHKVGYIFRDKISDSEFAAQICEQRLRASNRAGIETCYIDGVTVTDFEDAVKMLSDAGCTDIISCSPVFTNVLNSIARNYLDLNFISYGALVESINISAYSEAPYQGAYISGLVANFNSKTGNIGVLADLGLSDAVAVVNAVTLGSQMNQDGGAHIYAASVEEDHEVEKAIDALVAKGCDVIVCYTSTNRSVEYCEEKGIKFIGSLDYNGRENDYSNMLMYFYCQRDSYFLAQFKSMKMGTWTTMEYIGDMSNSIVNVSPALKAANDGTQELIDAIVPYLTSGAALVFRGPLKDNNGNTKYLETEIMTDAEISAMNWFVEDAESIGDFREVNSTGHSSPLEIKS